MPSQTPIAFASSLQLSTADLQLFRTNSFRLIQFRKNASANPLESHTFKTKDLKPFRFTHFQKKVGWTPCFPPDAHLQSPVTNHKSLRLSPLISALTSKRASKSFTSNTYEKHTQGEGGAGRTTHPGPSPLSPSVESCYIPLAQFIRASFTSSEESERNAYRPQAGVLQRIAIKSQIGRASC